MDSECLLAISHSDICKAHSVGCSVGCTVPAVPTEEISVQERNHKDSAKFQSTRHRKPSQGRASCASESGTYIVNFGGKGRTSIQASLGCWHHFCSHALQERMAGWSVYSRFTSPSFWILETKVPSLSGKSHNLQDAEDRLLPILTAKFYMTIILQKNIASAGIFLVQIRKTWRAFSKKSFSFIAFHLCNLLTKGRKELPMQTLPQKYKDIFLVELRFRRVRGRTEIQRLFIQIYFAFFSSEHYPPNIHKTSANYFDSPILSGSAPVAFILHNFLYFIFLPFPMFCRQSCHFLCFPSEWP